MSRRPDRSKHYSLSRRSLVASGGAALGATVFSTMLPPVRSALSADLPASPRTRPFVDALPLPSILEPTPRASFPAPTRQTPKDTVYYQIDMKPGLHSFHKDLQPSSIWGYNGVTLGPLIVAQANTTVLARFKNSLPTNDPVQIGTPIASIHRHGGFQAPEDDGYPGNFFPVGSSRDYVFLNPPEDSNHWYHDHSLDVTAENVYRGLAGGYVIFDDKDSLAGELDTNVGALKLPGRMVGNQRLYDVPLVFQDRQFNASGQLVYDSFAHNGFVGDKFTVNGKIQPFFNVEARRYRFRFLNGSNARQYEFVLKDGNRIVPFDYIIGTDNRLFEAPLTNIESFRIASAERVQVVIDFSKFAGKEILLYNRLEQVEGRKPKGVVDPGTPILKFIVGTAKVADPSRVPDKLRAIPADERIENVLARGGIKRRQFDFNRQNGAWAINGQLYDENRIDARPIQDQYEIWTFKSGGGWEHPVHVHLTNFFILTRNGQRPGVLERGWKDTVVVGGDRGDVEVLLKFSGFTGEYVMHCHTVEHEDARMMLNFEVMPKQTG